MSRALIAAFAVTIILVPLVRRFCERTQILDRPGTLKIHARPVPRLGGVAVFLGVLAGVLTSRTPGIAAARFFFAAFALVWFAGLLDDLRGVSPAFRLASQIAAAALLWHGGWRLPSLHVGPVGFMGVSLFVVLFVNAFNFLDGSDGLAAGVACTAALSYTALPQAALTPMGFAIAYSMVAACAAFLIFNFHPASIFVGDSGSAVLGFLAAFLGLDFAKAGPAATHAVFFAFVVAALPLLDAIRILVRRLVHRRSPFLGDRSHFYDLLLARRWTPRSVALTSWGVTAACGGVGILLVRTGPSNVWSLVAFTPAALWIAAAVAAPSGETAEDYEKSKASASF